MDILNKAIIAHTQLLYSRRSCSSIFLDNFKIYSDDIKGKINIIKDNLVEKSNSYCENVVERLDNLKNRSIECLRHTSEIFLVDFACNNATKSLDGLANCALKTISYIEEEQAPTDLISEDAKQHEKLQLITNILAYIVTDDKKLETILQDFRTIDSKFKLAFQRARRIKSCQSVQRALSQNLNEAVENKKQEITNFLSTKYNLIHSYNIKVSEYFKTLNANEIMSYILLRLSSGFFKIYAYVDGLVKYSYDCYVDAKQQTIYLIIKMKKSVDKQVTDKKEEFIRMFNETKEHQKVKLTEMNDYVNSKFNNVCKKINEINILFFEDKQIEPASNMSTIAKSNENNNSTKDQLEESKATSSMDPPIEDMSPHFKVE